jgi:hypothetical protein
MGRTAVGLADCAGAMHGQERVASSAASTRTLRDCFINSGPLFVYTLVRIQLFIDNRTLPIFSSWNSAEPQKNQRVGQPTPQ